MNGLNCMLWVRRGVLVSTVAAASVFGAASLAAQSPGIPPAVRAPAVSEAGTATANPGMAVELYTDTQGVNFSPYLHGAIGQISASWRAQLAKSSQAQSNTAGQMSIRLSIRPDGAISAMRLEQRSGEQALDLIAWGSITSVGSFAPLPAGFSGPKLELLVHFNANNPVAE